MTGGKLGVWLLGICCLAANGAEPEMNRIPAGDARLEYSSYVRKNVSGEVVGFDRVLPHGRNYQLDNPGVRLRFRCDAKDLQVELGYLERNNPVRARNGVGVFRIDGAGREEWRFDRPAPAGREPEIVTVKLPADGGFHDYELILPYGDRVEVRAVLTDPAARFERPAARPAKRVVFYGDSVTHGFTASRIDRTYPFLVGEKLGVEAVNLGLGGIGLNPVAAKQLAELPMDLLVVAIGVNDWQGGRPPEEYAKRATQFAERIHARRPDLPLVWITPLWVPPSWKPEKAKYDLPLYGEAAARALRELPGVRVVDGSALIDHDPALFDRVAVHPNDRGFAMMAERLSRQLEDLK